MAGSVNKVILIGRLGKDPEVRGTQGGGKIVSFSLATSDQWTDKASGERKERTERHRVVIFNEQIAGVAERFLSKGSMVHLRGRAADPGLDGQRRRGALQHRGRAGPLPGRADAVG